MAKYTAEMQTNCINFCSEKIARDVQEKSEKEMQEFTKESMQGLETQCSKMCLRKAFKVMLH